MDARERVGDQQEILRAMIDGAMANMWTSLPGIVQSVDFAKQTATIQPAIKSVKKNPDGTVEHVDLPVLADVPLHFPSGGGASMTFPVKAGDEALVVFSSRPTDTWHQSGGVQGQIDARTHDLSDGFALVGFKSSPGALSNVSSNSVQLRSDDGQHVVDLNPGSGVTITSGGFSAAFSPAGLAMTGGTITHNGKDIGDTHLHTGVVPGGGLSGVPA